MKYEEELERMTLDQLMEEKGYRYRKMKGYRIADEPYLESQQEARLEFINEEIEKRNGNSENNISDK